MKTNLYQDISSTIPEEITDVIVRGNSVRIERIVSTGQSSPDGFWYDQDESEWVLLLRGQAVLVFEGDDSSESELRMILNPGDCVNIVAHRRHRVEWTSSEPPTIWLAVFYRD